MSFKDDMLGLIAQTGQALAHRKRLEVLELLAQRPRDVSALAELTHLKVTTASAHLQVLREAGLVTSHRAGNHVIYELAGEDVAALLSNLMDVAERHRDRVHRARAERSANLDTVTVDQMEHLRQAGPIVILDVRPADEFAAGHISGAVSVPVAQLALRASELPHDATVVIYCRGRYCELSYEAHEILSARGRIVRVLSAGVADRQVRARWQVAA